MTFTPARLLVLAAVILFVLAGFGVSGGPFGELDLDSLGLAAGFASFLV